jgi:aminopeptidase N
MTGLRRSRDQIFDFDRKAPGYRVVHDGLSAMGEVTTVQTYQKGGWTLHMLRGLLGEEVFWNGIRRYYSAYKDRNASTDDFRRVMEETSGVDLAWFFEQWLYRGGHPTVSGEWQYDAAARTLLIALAQESGATTRPFRLPMDVKVALDGDSIGRVERIELTGARQQFRIPLDRAPAAVVLDPENNVLMEATFSRANTER